MVKPNVHSTLASTASNAGPMDLIDSEPATSSSALVSHGSGSGTGSAFTRWTTEMSAAPEAVFALIHTVKHEIIQVIDTVLTYEQLKTPTINFSIVRPLTLKLSKLNSSPKPKPKPKLKLRSGESQSPRQDDPEPNLQPPTSLIYCLLICRIHFLELANQDLAFSALNTTRADLCELLSIKLLNVFSASSAENSNDLLYVLTKPFDPLEGVKKEMFDNEQGVDEQEFERLLLWGKTQQENALELAIFSEAKRFVRSALVQQIVRAIYQGEVLYSPAASRSIIKDDYKTSPVVTIYDSKTRPFLDHTLLRVPRVRNRLEFLSFFGLMIFFILTLLFHSDTHLTTIELVFIFWASGFALDEFASVTENGLTTYSLGAYNVMDASFCLIFFIYLAIRISALWIGSEARSEFAFATLSLAGCILFPRLTISLLRDNVVLLALSAMVRQFFAFMFIVVLTASGFSLTFFILARARGESQWDLGHIYWLLLKIWLGNSFLGFEASQQFDPIYGPALIVAFAVLTQTLLLTILISLLSNTFAAVQANAETELLNQFALRTIERVKSDALTSYVPPLNLIAFIILYPLRWIVTPRYLHKIHVALTKLLNLPVLLVLAIITRIKFQHRGFFFQAAERTKEIWERLPSGWENPVDGVSTLFERQVDLNFILEESRESNEEDDGVQDSRTTKDDKAKKKQVQLTPLRTKTLVIGHGKDGHSRIESLDSPLAKVFDVNHRQLIDEMKGKGKDVGGASDGKKGKDVGGASDGKKDNAEVPESLTKRLDAIEAALAILVGEVVKSSEGTEEAKRPPLTSLTGAVEQDYSSAD